MVALCCQCSGIIYKSVYIKSTKQTANSYLHNLTTIQYQAFPLITDLGPVSLKVPVTFRARKAVLCLLTLHSKVAVYCFLN